MQISKILFYCVCCAILCKPNGVSVDKQIVMKSFDILFIFARSFFFSIVVIEFDVFSKSWIKFCTLWWKDKWESFYKGLRLSFVSRLSVRCWPQRFDRGKQVFIMLSDDLLLGTRQYLSSRRDRRIFFFLGGGGDRLISFRRIKGWVIRKGGSLEPFGSRTINV